MIDLDNTLADRDAAVRGWIAEFCAECGLPAEAGRWILELDADGYSERRTVMEAIVLRFELTSPVEEILLAYQQRVIELMVLAPGAMNCLNALRLAGHVVVIVTNGSTKQQHAKIDALGLRPAVDAVIVSADIGIKKPDPRIFEAAVAAVGWEVGGSNAPGSADGTWDNAWMVGDSPLHDIVGAHQLGIWTAWMRRGRTWADAAIDLTATPTVSLDSLAELPTLIAAN